MSGWAALGGWCAAVLAGWLALRWRRELDRQAEQLGRACHEVRGPLAAARLGLALGVRPGRLTPGRLRALDQELARAACALADLERCCQGAPPAGLELEAVDLRGLLEDSVAAWEAAAVARDMRLYAVWSGPPVVMRADRVRLAQALGNLIANALEHGGDPIEVRGSAAAGQVRIEVRDGGRGLRGPVAELMGRRGPRRRTPGDRGRGLLIASQVAAAHGGRLSSAPSSAGARLVLALPRRRAEPAPQVSRL